jgi:hypothetical protein
MDCDDAALRLPWMINGTIDADEAARLREHLAACAACRRELEETKQAAAVFSAHVPTSILMDMAWDRPATIDAALVSRHLEHCQPCAEELALARGSRGLVDEAESVVRPRPVAWWSVASVPASLAAGLAVGLFWATTRTVPPPADDSRVRPLESEVARLRESEQAMRAELDRLRRPQINLPVYELFPANDTTRSSGRQENDVVLPAGATQVAFVFGGGATSQAPSTVEIRDARQRTVWSGEGLRPGPLAAYALAIPRALLPDGDYVLAVRPAGGVETTYAIRVRAPR